VLVPLGFAMGMPFPTGLRSFARTSVPDLPASEFGEPANIEGHAVEWAWAMNAAASRPRIGTGDGGRLHFGLNTTLASGGAAYGLALALLPSLAPRPV